MYNHLFQTTETEEGTHSEHLIIDEMHELDIDSVTHIETLTRMNGKVHTLHLEIRRKTDDKTGEA